MLDNGSMSRSLRKYRRQKLPDTVVVTQSGACLARDVSLDGLSFQCLYGHAFPREWKIDILDINGIHLKSINVIKIWEKREMYAYSPRKFAVSIGVQFKKLKKEQMQILLRALK